MNARRDEVSDLVARYTHSWLINDCTGVRDPYAIDPDEDIVMVNAEVEGETAEKSKRSKKSKRMVCNSSVNIEFPSFLIE